MNLDHSLIFSGFLNKLRRTYKNFSNQKILASCAFPINTTFNTLNSAIAFYNKAFYWEKNNNGIKFLALGELIKASESFSEKFNYLEKELVSLRENYISNFDDLNIPRAPVWVGGVKFDAGSANDLWKDYKNSDWFIPRLLFMEFNGAIYAVCNFIYDKNFSEEVILSEFLSEIQNIIHNPCSKSAPIKISSKTGENSADRAVWIGIIESALDRISKNEFGKIVLSRKTELHLESEPDIQNLIERFNGKYYGCYIFAFRSGNSVFIGATPERLLKVKGKYFETEALAGSIRRGKDNQEDEELALSLLQNQKEVLEHKFVSDFVISQLKDFSRDIESAESPGIKKLVNIQHLWTPIRGELKEPNNLFQILENLAPTPAVCGIPRDAAMKAIKELENYPRGLYAGVIGWLNFDLTGEFAVGLRSALIQGRTVHAFAGGGIVKGSVPAKEYDETELKLKPILSLFNDENK